MKKSLSMLLIIIILCNFYIAGIMGHSRVEAGFWEDNKDGIMTVIKGFLMLWIMNLIRENVSGEDNFITSTIRKGFNLEQTAPPEEEPPEVTEKLNEPVEPEIMIEKSITERERQMVDLVNKSRTEEGLKSLTVDYDLVGIARLKARDMIEQNYFDHYSPTYGSPFTMLNNRNVDYLLAGENLAHAGTVNRAFTGLMESREHRENILDSRYDRLGVGIIEDEQGMLMVVQLFTDSTDLDK